MHQRGVGEGAVEDLFQEGGAKVVGRLRIGKAAGVGFYPVGKGGKGFGRGGQLGAVVFKDKLRHGPWGFVALGRQGEIGHGRGFAHGIDQRPVRKGTREGAEQQALRLHRGKVFAVDPDHIDRPACGLTCVTFSHHAGYGVGGGGQFDVLQGDAVTLQGLRADVGNEIVDLGIPAPCVPIDGLALGLGQDGVPVGGKGHAGMDGHQGEGGKCGLAKGAAVHGNPCLECDCVRDRRRGLGLARWHTQT